MSSHFHLDDGNGVHPSHSRKYKFIYGTEGTIRGTPKTILQTRSYEFPASFSKSVTNFATSPITARDDIVDYIAKIRPRSSATNVRSCSVESSVSSSENTSNKGSVRKQRYSPAASYCIAEEMVAQENIRPVEKHPATQTMDIFIGPSKNSRDLDRLSRDENGYVRRCCARFGQFDRTICKTTRNATRDSTAITFLSREGCTCDSAREDRGYDPGLITMLAGRKWKLIPTRDVNNLQQFHDKRALFRFATDLFLILSRRTENNFNGTHKNISDERCELKVSSGHRALRFTLESMVRPSIRDGCVTALLVTHGPKRKRAPRSLRWQWREAPESPLSAGVQRLTSP
ncbi:hypothetical protein ALC60_07458 [Trachymyrmex zeteki]|uniref:Uncharacterized protein n=1 Tax=Mycetomoellerius zeteki TaxID=64791 RepID=A0A151X049_9HYME|nr:hypothetical protein ALC60_07458 [Trachymyrmex zeteki]